MVIAKICSRSYAAGQETSNIEQGEDDLLLVAVSSNKCSTSSVLYNLMRGSELLQRFDFVAFILKFAHDNYGRPFYLLCNVA